MAALVAGAGAEGLGFVAGALAAAAAALAFSDTAAFAMVGDDVVVVGVLPEFEGGGEGFALCSTEATG